MKAGRMSKTIKISEARAAEISVEMVRCRRDFCADRDFFKASDLWEWLCADDNGWSIKKYVSRETEGHKRKAGVIALGDKVTLTVDSELWDDAKRGKKFPNFVLAHELGHLALDHHAKGAVVKNFQLYATASGRANIPPNLEELEAMYAAVFLQCGILLLDNSYGSVELALRAFSDVEYVRKARELAKHPEFRRELAKYSAPRKRVVL